jgi:hypothetical protein
VDDEEEGWTGRRCGIGRIEILIEFKDDALADAAHRANDLSLYRIDGRLNRAQDEWAVESEPLEAASYDVPGEGLEIDDDVGELGQAISGAS